ncbi:histidine kinase [Micromonospora sp. NPDC005163]
MDAATCDVNPPRTWRSAPVGVTTVAMGVLIATVLWSATRSGSTALVRADVALAVAALALVPVVVRRPEVAGVLAGLLVALSPVATPVASFAVLFTARNRPFRQAAVVAAVGVAGEAVQAVWRPMPSLPYGWRLVLMTAAYAALLGWGTWAQARHALLAALRDRAWRAEQEQERRVVEARAAERSRIAREMHDVLAHRLSLLAAAAGAMEYRPDAPPERLSAAAGVIRASAHHALDELREVITLLRSDDAEAPADAPPGQTLADLPRLVEEARRPGSTSRSTTRSARRPRSRRRSAAPPTGSRRRH